MLLKSRKYSVAVAFGLAGLAAVAMSTPAQARNTTVVFRACNNTDKTIMLASSFIPIGQSDNWRNKGWQPVSAHSCAEIFRTENTTFYARAERKGHSDQAWGSDIKQCVEYPGPYDFFTASDETSCPEGQPADFKTFRGVHTPVYSWNINVQDMNDE